MKYARLLLVSLALLFTVSSCTDKKKKIPAFNSSYGAYINSFTSGVISKKSSINIYFNSDVNTKVEDILTFEPAIEGELAWVSMRHLQFIPKEDLEPSGVYNGKLSLSKLLEVPDSMRTFEFGFQILKTDFDWGQIALEANPPNQMKLYQLKGTVVAADEEDLETVKNLLSAKSENQNYSLRWFNGTALRQYNFTIDSIERKTEAYQLTLSLAKKEETFTLVNKKIEIPALGDFKFLGYDVIKGAESEIILKFSDPLMADQNLTGLVTLEGANEVRLEVNNTQIRVFPPEQFYGKRSLSIFVGIKNIEGYSFKENKTIVLDFQSEKPQIEVLAKGNIMPQSKQIILPFKAISLNAVDIKVVRVSENNIFQFLQNNDLAGDRELYRVGEVVAKQKIDLAKAGKTLTDWNSYGVNLADLVKTEPGAIYKVYFSFKKEYSVYPDCDDFNTEDNPQEEGYDYEDYYYYEDYYDYNPGYDYNRGDFYFTYPQGYTWRERDNPCHVSYYNQDRFVTHNVLVSDLGIIAKRNDKNEFDIAITNLKTTDPITDADVNIYTYQHQLISKTKTDGQGFALLKADKGIPFFLEVIKGNQKGYLKLGDGFSLSLSAFEVAGTEVQKGLKGFIYGERGVWRPGDSVYLNFMLEDLQQTLPANHPVVFELTNPRGALVDRQVCNQSVGRIYDFTTYTHPKAVTGNYTAKVRVGDVVFTKRIKIETVKPNRLEIELAVEDKVFDISGGKLKADLAVEWLTGLEAANTKVDIDATIVTLSNPFENYKSFRFSDATKNFNRIKKQVFDGETDVKGKAQTQLDIGEMNYAPGMLKARFVVKAFEAGGDLSTEYFDTKMSPYQRYVGMKLPRKTSYFLKTGESHQVEIRTVDKDGKPLSIKDLSVKVFKVDWHWWYDASNSYLSRYVNDEATYLYSKTTVSTQNGKGSFALKVDYPAWGRFLVRVCDGNGHCSSQIAYFDWPAGVGDERPEIAGATVLSFAPSKEKYNVGEEVVTKIPVAQNGRILVTIENGSGILKKEWIETNDKKEVEFRFTAEANMAPNVFISASFIQPHAQTKNDRPIRLYGIAPVGIVNEKTVLKPKIEAADVWRPEQKVNVNVSEENGKAMSYTLAIVDEGLLNLTRFQTPDPWKSFYAKEALGIKTFDMYNDVLGAFAGTLAQIFAIGGDVALNNKGLNNQNRFKPMVRHLGPFTLKAGEKANHSITLPNYIGKVRIMVVATADVAAYGNAEKSVHIRKPLMVLSSLPRTFSPGEEVTLPVTVFAMEKQVRDVSIKVKASGGVTLEGGSTKQISFSETGQKVVDFKLKIPENVGNVTIRIDASSGSEKAYDETQMVIRAPNPPIKNTYSFYLKPGGDTTLQYTPLGLNETNEMQLTAYGMPDFHMQERLKYLFGFPHGCAEQTVSRVFPLLYLDGVMNLSDNMKKERKQNLRIAFQKLYELQSSNGGIRYWPGNAPINDYVTTYAGAFMQEAKKQGYDVPNGFIPRYKKYQRTKARSWSPVYYNGDCKNCLDQAYRLRIMAEYGEIEIGAMNRLKGESLTRTELWNLAGAYAYANQKNVAEALIEKAKVTFNNRSYYYYYGSSLRNKAMELEVLNQLDRDREAFTLAQEICRDLNGNDNYATHSLALGLKSVLTYFSTTQNDKQISWTYSSSKLKRTFTDVSSISTLQQKENADKPYEIVVKNTGNTPLNYSLTRAGTPLRFGETAAASGVSIKVNYTYPNGGYLDVSKLKQGQDFVAEVTIMRNEYKRERYRNMALTQIFPSGWEIINTRLINESEQSDSESGTDSQTVPDYQDIRDDRVYTYFSLTNYKEVSFKIQLNATYAGKYYLPAMLVEDMYNLEIRANTESTWVEVER